METLSHRAGIVALLSMMFGVAHAEIRLPAVISDHAVLQSGEPVAIWGWSSPEATVHVSFMGSAATPPNGFSAVAGRGRKMVRRLASDGGGNLGKDRGAER